MELQQEGGLGRVGYLIIQMVPIHLPGQMIDLREIGQQGRIPPFPGKRQFMTKERVRPRRPPAMRSENQPVGCPHHHPDQPQAAALLRQAVEQTRHLLRGHPLVGICQPGRVRLTHSR